MVMQMVRVSLQHFLILTGMKNVKFGANKEETMKVKITLLLLAVVVGFSMPANATLIDRGTGMIYDTDQGITWLQDANYAATSGYDDDGDMNWEIAMEWANQLEYGGYEDWRLPNTPGTTSGFISEGEMGHLYWNEGINSSSPNPFLNIQSDWYWYGTETASDPSYSWEFAMYEYGLQSVGNKEHDSFAWAVRDGDYGPSVTTTETYLTDYLTLGDTFTFDYWWEMGMEPTDNNFDILFFNGTGWETFGWELNFGGSSNGWETASFYVPEWARGQDTQIMFNLYDFGQETNPTVYLNNIRSSAAPVPEPTTIVLLGAGLVGLLGASRKKFKK